MDVITCNTYIYVNSYMDEKQQLQMESNWPLTEILIQYT